MVNIVLTDISVRYDLGSVFARVGGVLQYQNCVQLKIFPKYVREGGNH